MLINMGYGLEGLVPTDPKSRSRLANQQKSALIERLGGQCVECGSTDRLQIDHPYGRDWKLHKLTHYARIRRYLKEESAGLIRILCLDCNEKIRPRARRIADDVMDPF